MDPHCLFRISGRPCNIEGEYLAPDAIPEVPQTPASEPSRDDWTPFDSKAAFRAAELLFVDSQMSQGHIDTLMDIWNEAGQGPFTDHQDLYDTIDSIALGDFPWQSFCVRYQNEASDDDPNTYPQWMSDPHEVFYRDPHLVVKAMLANHDFDDGMDFAPHRVFNKNEQQFDNMMSGEWAWEQAVRLTPFRRKFTADDSDGSRMK